VNTSLEASARLWANVRLAAVNLITNPLKGLRFLDSGLTDAKEKIRRKRPADFDTAQDERGRCRK
jgi:hypothetical protein